MKTVHLTMEQCRELESTVMDLTIKLDRAACVIQDLTERYFGYILTSDNLWKLEAGFEEHKIKSDIAWDYVYDSKKLAEQIETMTQCILISGREVHTNE